MIPRRWVLSLVGSILCIVGIPHAVAFDLSRTPTPSDLQAIAEKNWTQVRDELKSNIDKAYKPATLTQSSSTTQPAFGAWIDIWRLATLLATSEEDSLATLFLQHLYKNPTGELTFLPVGFPFPVETQRLELAEIQQIVKTTPELHAKLLPEGFTLSDGLLADRAGSDLTRSLLTQSDLRNILLNNLSEEDNVPMVLEQLRRIQEAYPDDFQRFPSLAVAIALVWDMEPPRDWPHHQVHPEQVPKESYSASDRFAFWIKAAKEKRLLSDMTKLDASLLKFMVDAPVSFSELEWAQKHVRESKSTFARVFSSIRYQSKRLLAGQFDWSDGPYTLEAIQKQGGICVDQAYFAMLSGKARGLPTLFFTGQGRDGGHAWFGFLKSDHRWEMDCGRYENQNYAVGEAIDPQTWLPITDHDLRRMSLEARQKESGLIARRDLALVEAYFESGEISKALAACAGAMRSAPDLWEVWEVKAKLLEQSDIKTKDKFWKDAMVAFKNDADILARCNLELSKLAQAEGNQAKAASYQRATVSHNRLQRSDLSVKIVAEQMQDALAKGDLSSADKIYREALHALAQKAGGDLFYQMTKPIVKEYLAQNNQGRARSILDLTRRSLKPQTQSILDQELLALEAELKNNKK